MRVEPDAASGRILVVDDNEMNRDMLSRRLIRRGYHVEMAENGRAALDMVETGAFDVVLLDIMMPEMNGYEVLERLKAHEQWQHIPVVMISAADDMDSIVQCIKLGAADFLPKPFNVTLLAARVEACLDRKRLHDREQMHLESLRRELEIGRKIQRGFLPAALPQAAGWEIAARFLPAREVAGDFYDAFRFGSRDRLGLVVADVCDKGVGASLFMALFRSLIRAFSEQCIDGGRSPAGDLLHVVRATNDYIARIHDRANMFATVFIAALDTASGDLAYVNAGHDAPAIVSPAGHITRLQPTGPALGLLPDLAFEAGEAHLHPGSLLAAFTDGVTDADGTSGPSGDPFFGEDRLMALLAAERGSASGALDAIVAAVDDFTGSAAPFDDITLLAVRREG